MPSLEKLLKTLDLLKPGDLKKKKLTDEEKIKNLQIVSDTFNAIPKSYNPTYLTLISKICETYITYLDENNVDIRLKVEDYLIVLFKSHMDFINRILVEIFREIKHNGSLKTLKFCLLRFAISFYHIKRVKYRAYIFHVLPTLKSLLMKQEEALYESIFEFVKLVFPKIGPFTTQNEIQGIISVLLSLLFESTEKQLSATSMRFVSQSLIIITQHSRNPKINFIYVISYLIDKGTKNMCPPIMTWILLFTLKQFWSNFSVIFIETTPININETCNYSPSKLHVKNDLVSNKFDERNNGTHIINRDAENILTLLILSWQYAILQQSSSDVNVVNAGLDLTICLMEQFVLNPTHEIYLGSNEENNINLIYQPSNYIYKRFLQYLTLPYMQIDASIKSISINNVLPEYVNHILNTVKGVDRKNGLSTVTGPLEAEIENTSKLIDAPSDIDKEENENQLSEDYVELNQKDNAMLLDDGISIGSSQVTPTTELSRRNAGQSSDENIDKISLSSILLDETENIEGTNIKEALSENALFYDEINANNALFEDDMLDGTSKNDYSMENGGDEDATTLDTNLQEKIFLIQIPYPKILLPTQDIIDQDVHISILNVLYHKVLSQFILEYKHDSNETETQPSAFIKTSNASLSKILVTIHTNSVLFLGKCIQIFSLVRDFQFILPTQVTFTAKNGLDETIISKKCLLEDLLKLSSNFTDVSLLFQTCNLLAHTAISLALIHVTGRPKHIKIESSDLQHLSALEKFCYDSLRYFLQNTNGTPHKTDLNISISQLNNPLVQSNTLLACRDLIEQLTHLAMFYDLTSNTNAEICAFIKYVTQLELSTKYWLCQINHTKLLLCMNVTFANKFVYQTKMDQLCYYINFPEGKNLAMFWIHMLIGKLKYDDFRIRSVATHTLVDFIAKSMQISTADNIQTNWINIIHCLCCTISNCQSIPTKSDILRYIITILNTQMLESRPKLKCGFIECLAMLCKKFLPISYPQPWNIITIDVNNSFASGPQNIPHSTFFKKTCDDSYLTLLSVLFTHEELMCNITLHQHIIFLVTQITTAYLYHNSRWITFSCRDPFSLHWPAVLDRTMIKTLDTALTHIFRLLTICGDIFACINPLSGSSGSFLRKHQQRSILYHGPGQRKSDTIIPITQENTTISDKSGSPETSTFSKLASTLKIKKEQLPTDKQPSPTQNINATNSREDKYHQMFLDFSNYHNVTLYQKIYAVLARSYQNYLTTTKDADKTKFYMFCDSLLAAISQMVELMSFYEVAPIIDTILYSLNAMYLTFTPSVIKLLIQLMKSLFGTNLLYLDSDLREDCDNKMISSLKNLTPYETQDPKNFFKYYLGWKINFDGKSPTHLRTAKNFSHFNNNKIPPPNNEQIDENDKDIMSNHEILTNISVYIRKFEHLVIRSLKMYTITNSTELQITILDMLIQLLILRVNYRLLDSEQIFLNYLIKQIESFELGYVNTNPLLIYNLFQFLSLLSRDSTLITKSRLISLAELVIASDYGTPHIARGVYLVLIQDIFLFDAYCSWTYKSKFISPVNEENQTMRDVIIATLVKYAEQPQILELLIIIAQSLKYENEIFYLKYVKQTLIPLLKGRIGNIRSFTQPELTYQLFESVESELNTEQIFSIIQPFCQKILPDYVNSMQSYRNSLILQTSFLKLLNAHYNIKPGNDAIDTWNNPKVKDEYLQSLWSLIYFGAKIACEKQKNKSNIFPNSLHNTMYKSLYDFFKECIIYFNKNSVYTDNVAVRDKISTEIRNDLKSLNEQIFGEYRWIIYTDSLLWLTYMELMHKFELLDVRLLITFMESTQPVIQFNQNTENIYTTILKMLLNCLILGYNQQDLERCPNICDTNHNLSFDTNDISNTLKQLNINNNIQATPLYILKNIGVWAHLIIPLFHCDQIKDYVLKAFTYIILPIENNDADLINNCTQSAKNKPLKLLAISAWLEYINNDVLPKILVGYEISQYFNGNNSTTQSQITPLYNTYVILNAILTWKDFAKSRDLEQRNTVYEQSYHNFYVLKIFITQMFWDISSQPYTRRLVRESVFQSLKQANQYMTTFKDLKCDIKKACLKHFTLSDLILFYKKCALSTVFTRSIMGIDSLRDFITHLADKEENIFTINNHPTIADQVGNDTHGFLIYLRDVLQNAKKLKITEAKYPCWLGSTLLNLSCDDLAHLLKITDITMSQMMLVYRCFRKKLYFTILRNRINPFENVAKLASCFNLLNRKLVGMMREMNEIDDDIDDTIETILEVFLILTHHPIVSKTLEFPDNLLKECTLTLHKIIKTILNENRLYDKNVQNSPKILKCLECCGHFAIKNFDTNTDLIESAISYLYLILHPNVTNLPSDISMHSKIFKLVAWMVEMYTTRKINRNSCWEMSIYRTLYVLFRVSYVHNFVLFHLPINMETTESQPIKSNENAFIDTLKISPFSPEAFFMDLDVFRRFSTLVIMMGWSDVSNFQEICVILTSAINRFMSHDDHLDDTPNHTLMEENNSPGSPTTQLERSDTPIIDTGTVDKVELVTLAIIAVRTITHLILYTTLKPNPGDPLYCEYPETCIPTCDLFKRIDIKKRYNAQLESLSLYFGLDNRKNGKFWSEEIPSWPWRCNFYPTHNMGQISLKHAWLVMGSKCVVRSSLSEADQRKLNLSSPNQGIDQDPNDTVLIALEEKETQFSPLYHSSGCDMISILKLITDLYANAFAFLQKLLAPNYKTTYGTRNENSLIANTTDHSYKMIGDFTIPQIESKSTVRSVSRQESFMVDKIIPYRKLLLELIKSTIYISDLFSNPAQFEWAQAVFTQLYEVFNDESSSLLVENSSTGLPLSLELFLDGGNNISGTTSKNYTSPEDKNICRDEYLMSYIAFGLCKSLASLGMSAKLCESTYAIITNVFKSSSILTKILGFKMSFYLLESNPYANEKLIQLLANHAYTLLDYLTPKTLVSHAYVDVLMKTLFYLGETFQNIPLPELTTCSTHMPIPFHDNNCDLYVRKLLGLLVKNGFFALPSYIAELKNIKGIDLKQANCSFVEHFHQIDLDRNNCRVNCQLCRLLLLNIVPEGPVLDFITAHSLSSFISITSWAHQSHQTPSILFIEPRGPLLTSYINLLSTCMFWSKLKRQNAFRNNAPNSKPLVALNNSHNYSNTVNNVGPSSHQTQALTGYIMQYTEFMISDYTDLTDNLTTQTILFDSGPSFMPGTILEFTFAADLIDKWLNRYTTSTTFPNSLPDLVNHDWNANTANLKNSLLLYYTFHHIYHKAMVENGTPLYTLNDARKLLASDNNDNNVIRIEHDWILLGMEKILAIMSRYIQKGELETENIGVENSNSAIDVLQYNITHQFWKLITLLTADTMTDDSKSIFPYVLQRMCNPSILSGDSIDDCSFIVTQIESFFHSIRNNELKRRFIDIINGFIRTNHKINNESINLIFKILQCVNEHIQLKTDPLRE